MKTNYRTLLAFVSLILISAACSTPGLDEETEACIQSLEEKGHSHEEAQDMCEAGEVIDVMK